MSKLIAALIAGLFAVSVNAFAADAAPKADAKPAAEATTPAAEAAAPAKAEKPAKAKKAAKAEEKKADAAAPAAK